mmetsp:Transcript_23096/g.48117  ORF Transcript_23096/g.48117 Transcript_23096/m.48117 type:complete len:269 (-) Transcript_23096:353-1159(-)
MTITMPPMPSQDFPLRSLSDISLLSFDLNSEDVRQYVDAMPDLQKSSENEENEPSSNADAHQRNLMLASLGSLGLNFLPSLSSGLSADKQLFLENGHVEKPPVEGESLQPIKKPKRDWNAMEMSALNASVAPASMRGNPADVAVLAFAAKRNIKNSSSAFVEPTELDVLCERGGRSRNNPGNMKYLATKDIMQARYLASDKEAKTPISQELLDIVHAWGGRFLALEKTSHRWYEIDNKRARKKCSQALRDINTDEARAAKRAKYPKRK